MSDVSGIPNLGIPGLSGFNGGGGAFNVPSGLAGAQDQYLQNQRFFGDQADTMAAANAYSPWANSGGGFGVMPAHYAGVGAAYGRATGGFGGYGAKNADPFTPVPTGGYPSGRVTRGPDLPNISPSMPAQPPIPYLGGGGMPFGGGGFSPYSGSPFSRGTSPIDMSGGGAPFGGGGFSPGAPPPASGPMVFNDLWNSRGARGLVNDNYFNDITAQPAKPPTSGSGPAGGTSFIEPDIASRPGRLGMPNSQALLGYDPANSASFAPGSGEGFQGRFGLGFRNAGTPNQYTTEPYTDAQGQTHQPSQMPPGFQTPFSVDNPGGALPASRGSPFPIMGAGGDDSQDTLTPSDSAASPPFPSGGASPFPFAGGYQGSMRDRIASAITGNSPLASGSPTVMQPTPIPMQSQMNDAWSRIGAGRGMTVGATPVPPPQSAYMPINQAIYDIGNVSRPGMFDNLSQPLGSMFAPSQYRGR